MDIIRKTAARYGITLSQDSIEALAGISRRKEYGREQSILGFGDTSRHMYIVESGIVRQFYYKDGRNITEHFSCEGDVAFSIESLFRKEPTRLYMEAIEPSTVCEVEYSKLKELTFIHSDINALLQAILETDLVQSQRKADSWRFETSHERYERFCREYPKAFRRASIAHIASYLLMSPETLSRVRSGKL